MSSINNDLRTLTGHVVLVDDETARAGARMAHEVIRLRGHVAMLREAMIDLMCCGKTRSERTDFGIAMIAARDTAPDEGAFNATFKCLNALDETEVGE